MAMNKVPTLILGIGGIGCRIAAGISDLISEKDREYVGFVGMDTNIEDLKKLKSHGIKTIQTSDERRIRDYLQKHPEYISWFPVNRFTVDRGMLNGAGQIRAVSRLAALAAEESGMFIPIQEEINRIRSNKGDGSNGNLTVMVVGSITGGTGAGLFLQMPYYIRKIMKNTDGLDAIIIRGMFVGPDLTAIVQPSKINKDAVRVNGYACLKELNAFYMTQNLPDEENNLELDFYEKSNQEEIKEAARLIKEDLMMSGVNEMFDDDFSLDDYAVDAETIAGKGANIPYNYLYLIEGTTSKGSVGNVALSNVENQIAHMVFTLMFTPVKDNALSVEDNMLFHDMETGGMNRYSSAGLCRLLFPSDLAKEYVTLCTVRDLVKEEWLLIDRSYNDQVTDARSRQRTDGMVEIPSLRKSYPSLFEKAVKGNGKLGKLYSEAFIETPDHTVVSRAASFMKAIESQVKLVIEDEDIQKLQSDCELNEERMKKFTDAQSEISSVFYALEEYQKLARKIVSEKQGEIANELFPPSWESMRNRMDSKVCIYQWLSEVHPITARYLCYDLMHRLEKRISSLESKVEAIDLDRYLEEDYDPKEPGVQSPEAALSILREKQNFFTKIIKNEQNSLIALKKKVKDETDNQREMITMYIKLNLELYTCQSILSRVEQLAENYRIFFQTIGTMIEENNDHIARLEDVRMPLGQKGVYCSKEAFKAMVAEYQGNIELPVETKKAVFEQLFHVLADDFSIAGKEETERQRENRAAQKRSTLNGIFTTAVVDTIRTDVVKRGAGIVDLNIHQALLKQLELEKGITEANCRTFKEQSIAYIRDQIDAAMKMAEPMLAVDQSTMADNTETVYLAVHPDCAATQAGKPNVGATKELYVPEATAATDGVQATVLMDEEFSPCEIICFKARYKFSIEDLVKYRPDSDNARAYAARIANLGRNPGNSNDPDAFKTVVNPHLNRYWHEEGFIPAMTEEQQRRDKLDTIKAFVYSIGMDCFKRIIDEETLTEDGKGRLTWYVFTPQGAVPVKSCGKLIGNSYADLYHSIPFNGKLKKYILEYASSIMKRMKGYEQGEELFKSIIENWFIEDLIQSKENNDDANDKNLLDIFLEMREYMQADKWNALFDGLLETLWEFCAYLFDNSGRLVNAAVASILKLMYCHSSAGKHEKEGVEMSYGEQRLKEQVMLQLKKRYHK